MKIHLKISKNFKGEGRREGGGNSNFCYSKYRPDFLSVLYFVSGSDNTSVGQFKYQ